MLILKVIEVDEVLNANNLIVVMTEGVKYLSLVVAY